MLHPFPNFPESVGVVIEVQVSKSMPQPQEWHCNRQVPKDFQRLRWGIGEESFQVLTIMHWMFGERRSWQAGTHVPAAWPRRFHESGPESQAWGSARSSELVRYIGERRRSVGSDRRNCSDADNDDQGQHNRVFNSGWAIFTLQKSLQLQGEILHNTLRNRSVNSEPTT